MELKALETARASEEQQLISVLLGDIGLAYMELGQSAQAVDSLQECIRVRQALNLDDNTAYVSLLGVAYSMDGAYQQGLQTLLDAANRDSQAGRLKEQAVNLIEAGRTYLSMGQIEEARALFGQAKTLQAKLPPDALAGLDSELTVADKMVKEGKFNPDKQRDMLGMVGVFYLEGGASEVALRFFHRALRLSIEANDKTGEMFQFTNLGGAYQSLSRYDEAITCLDQAVALSREMKNQMAEAAALNTLGIAYRHLNQWEKAIQNYNQAAALAQQLGNQGLLAQVKENLEMAQQRRSTSDSVQPNELDQIFNSALENLGRRSYRQAIRDFERVIPLSRAAGNKITEGAALSNIGTAYQLSGNFAKAAVAYEQALALKEPNDKAGRMGLHQEIGIAYLRVRASQICSPAFGTIPCIGTGIE